MHNVKMRTKKWNFTHVTSRWIIGLNFKNKKEDKMSQQNLMFIFF